MEFLCIIDLVPLWFNLHVCTSPPSCYKSLSLYIACPPTSLTNKFDKLLSTLVNPLYMYTKCIDNDPICKQLVPHGFITYS